MTETARDISVEMGEGSFSIDVKRFHVPFVVRYTCPHCGMVDTWEPDYLSYPTANAVDRTTMYCEKEDDDGNDLGCGKRFALPLYVECRVRAATPEEITEEGSTP